MMQEKPINIESVSFKEESLPSGRKLLHFIFKQKFGDYHYRWTPPWKGDCGVERLFFKALEVEEWNDYDGVWSKELKRASEEIPSLEALRLPVKISVGGMMGPLRKEGEEGEGAYRVAIEIMGDDKPVRRHTVGDMSFVCIGEVRISWEALKTELLGMPVVRAASKTIDDVNERDDYGNIIEQGIRFHVWLRAGAGQNEYQCAGRQLSANTRAFLRKHLADYNAIKKGFEEG